MNLESTIETVAAYLPEEIRVSEVLTDVVSRIPADMDFGTIAKFLLFSVNFPETDYTTFFMKALPFFCSQKSRHKTYAGIPKNIISFYRKI